MAEYKVNSKVGNNIRITIKDPSKFDITDNSDSSDDIVAKIMDKLEQMEFEDYLEEQMILLQESMNRLNQAEVVSDDDKYIPTTKLIRLIKPIPRYLLELEGYRPINVSGMFVEAEGLLLSPETAKYLDKRVHKTKKVYYPESDGFPEGYAYGTFNYYGKLGFVLKQSFLTEYLYTGSHWRYLLVDEEELQSISELYKSISNK